MAYLSGDVLINRGRPEEAKAKLNQAATTSEAKNGWKILFGSFLKGLHIRI